MPFIILKFKDKMLQEYPIEIGQTLTIGRYESNDIVIDNMAISGEHARIDSVSATFIITDLESTNGTFVNDELISSHGLRNQDRILIGKHELIFDRSDLERRADSAEEDQADDRTRVLDTAEYRDLINKTTGKAPPTPPEPAEPTGTGNSGGFISRFLEKIFG